MKIDRDLLDHIANTFIKLQNYERKHNNGWIQAFMKVNHIFCSVCSSNQIVCFPYPSLQKPFRSFYVFGCTFCGISWLKKEALDLGV